MSMTLRREGRLVLLRLTLPVRGAVDATGSLPPLLVGLSLMMLAVGGLFEDDFFNLFSPRLLLLLPASTAFASLPLLADVLVDCE